MQTLDPKLDIEGFFARLRDAEERALLLDYDGTLAPFHVEPRLALPYPRACALLREILSIPRTRVVIVSGRPLSALRAPLALLPHTEVWASHGWEHVIARQVSRRVPCAYAREELARAAALVEPLKRRGARIETKIASVAVHWRGLAQSAVVQVRARSEEAWGALAFDELVTLPFDGGLEIRARGLDKGHAVRQVLSTCGAGAVSAYLGDDRTDEDAFSAIRGHGLAVLVRDRRRDTRAELWLPTPHELTAFLERWRPAPANAQA